MSHLNILKIMYKGLHLTLAKSDKIGIFDLVLNVHEEGTYISDHIIDNNRILPGAVYIEAICEASEILGLGSIKKILSTVWVQPFICNHIKTELNIKVVIDSNKKILIFEFYSYDEKNKKIIHANSKVQILEASTTNDNLKIDLKDIYTRCASFIDKNECYTIFREMKLNYGPDFKTISYIKYKDEEVISHLELPENLINTENEYYIHPNLLDGAFQSVIGAISKGINTPFVPYAFKSMDIRGRLNCICNVYVKGIKNHNIENSATKRFDILMLDESGDIIIRIEDFCINILRTEFKSPVIDSSFLLYYPANEERQQLILDNKSAKLILAFRFDDNFSDALIDYVSTINNRSNIISVKRGDNFKRINSNSFEINPDNLNDYFDLIRYLKKEELIPQKIIITSTYENNNFQTSITQFNRFVFLAQSIIKAGIQDKIDIINISFKPIGINKALHLAIDGYNKTLTLERKNIRGRCIVIESEKEDVSNELLSSVFNELFNDQDENLIILKEGKRILSNYHEIRLGSDIKINPPLKNNGVYIITGGMGEVGYIFAKYLAKKYHANLVLTGRSVVSTKILERISLLESYGSNVVYVRGDISVRKDVENIIFQTKRLFRNINGIIHCAGVIHDSFIINKTVDEIEMVLSPKINGVINLDEATKNDNLDLFIMFSSATAVIGNMGQADYAYANNFMDHFATFRENLRTEMKRNGRTISINWPIWAEGGMKIDTEILQMIENKTGIKPLNTETALKAFEYILQLNKSCIGVVVGDRKKILHRFKIKSLDNESLYSRNPEDGSNIKITSEISKTSLKGKACDELLNIFSDLFKVQKEEIGLDTDLSDYGFSSIMIMNFLNILENRFGEIIEPNEILYIKTINEYADFLLERGFIKDEISKTDQNLFSDIVDVKNEMIFNDYDSKPTSSSLQFNKNDKISDCNIIREKKVAIIGMSCKFPKANNINEYWRNLRDGIDVISEIPRDRLNVDRIFSEDKSEPYKSYSKWGGFIDDIYSFDADYFKIPYQNVALMDPKQRIMLELTQDLIEHAGYSRNDLDNSKTSVFIGTGESSYATNKMSLLPESGMKNSIVSLIQNMISARISDYYNLKSESLNIDTACSSSLVAIHHAAKSILSGDSDYSIAGGIDLILDEFPFIGFSKAGVLSDDGVSYVFDKKANGFVIGEGAGLVLLKDYQLALNDGDQIFGIISGSAVNNDGNTVGVTVPNQQAQKDVICEALSKAEISAESISYLEAHGTGTLLGDPIEVKAASLAFQEHTEKKGFCAIGSVKSNIGHLQRAAGVASLIKVILALNNKIIPPTLHCKEPHPRFKFQESPFYPNLYAQEWCTTADIRRAGISSFGFGGTNCHMIVEEFIPPTSYIQRRHSLPKTKFNKQLFCLDNSQRLFSQELNMDVPAEDKIYKLPESQINDFTSNVERYLKEKVAQLIDGLNIDEIDSKINFMDMGIDSIRLIRLADNLSKDLNIELYPTIFFEYPNGKEMAEYLVETWGNSLKDIIQENKIAQSDKKQTKVNNASHIVYENNNIQDRADLTSSLNTSLNSNRHDIAIIGMSGLFAGSTDLDSFWNNLIEQKDLIIEIPQERFDYNIWFDPEFQKQNQMYCKWGSFINNADYFDSDFFNISRREAEAMDPQLRKLLQVLYCTTEDAGYSSKIHGTNTGMYVGACYRDFFYEMGYSNENVDIYDGTGNALTMLANRPSYYFDLKGPSMSIDTACSSSLVALHLAIKALREKECDMAFVAGVNLILSSWRYRYFCSIGALSPTGRCHTFDEKADGYVPGESIASVLLKPLEKAIEDGDRIHAIIKGTAVNNGGYTASITAPSVNLEKKVIESAWIDAGINPETLGYIEAHGTGTTLGDPIEIEAINKAFASYTQNKAFCSIGSVKANIGHTEGAAGIAGIIKAVLTIKNKEIPAMPMYGKLNPYIKLENSPLYINNKRIEWKSTGPRRAAVSAFGFGGTYAHVVLEEFDRQTKKHLFIEKRPRIIVISAKSEIQLRQQISIILSWAEKLKQKEQILSKPHKNIRPNVQYVASEFLNEIKQYISNVLAININDIDNNETLECLGLDTIKQSIISSMINDKYKIVIPIVYFNPMQSLEELSLKIFSQYQESIVERYKEGHVKIEDEEFATVELDDLAWTLQTGREEMNERIAFVVNSWSELIKCLNDILKFTTSTNDIFRGSLNTNDIKTKGKKYDIKTLIKKEEFSRVAKLWVNGFELDWRSLYSLQMPSLIMVPSNPFKEEGFGFFPKDINKKTFESKNENSDIIILSEEDESDLKKFEFSEILNPDNPFAKEHVINSKPILPGAVCIEIMRAAAEATNGKKVHRISDLIFLNTIEPDNIAKNIFIRVQANNEYAYCIICNDQINNENIVYSKCRIEFETDFTNHVFNNINIVDLQQSLISYLSDKNIYNSFSEIGFNIGKRHRTLKALYYKNSKGLAKLELPNISQNSEYFLNPLLLDGAFHAVLALTKLNVPFYLSQIEEIIINSPLDTNCFAYIDIIKTEGISSISANVEIYNENGGLLMLIKGIKGVNISQPKLIEADDVVQENTVEGLLAHESELIKNGELANVVSSIFNKYAKEEVSIARSEIAPWIFISSKRDCYAYLNKSSNILVMFNFVGHKERYNSFLAELMSYSEKNMLELELITKEKTLLICDKKLTATNFASIQRIIDLDKFSLNGNEKKKLRYLVSKFQKNGNCRTEEYKLYSDKDVDLNILSVIDSWCSTKKTINSYVQKFKKKIREQKLSASFRFFLTYINEQIQNVIVLEKMPTGGYLMDMEFYSLDMPLGGLEFGITEIISKLKIEGETVLSLGVTWGVSKDQSIECDQKTVQILDELRMQNIFVGDGNFQFKNKFCPENTTVYLVHLYGNNPNNVEDIIMMIASPGKFNLIENKNSAEKTDRMLILKEYGFNPMLIPCEKVELDFVTDSWSEITSESINKRMTHLNNIVNNEIDADEVLKQIFPFSNIILTSSGRCAESLLYKYIKTNKTIVLQNLLFPTGLYYQLENDKIPVEIPDDKVYQLENESIFKGNVDIMKLKNILNQKSKEIAYLCIELSSNASGGCPISLQNINDIKTALLEYNIPIVMDATRILENAIFISIYEKEYQTKNIWEIVNTILSYADYVVASLTKDFSINIGGVIATNDNNMYYSIKKRLENDNIGLNATDRKLVGLAFDNKEYLISQVKKRMEMTQLLWKSLKQNNIPIAAPCGGHCVLINVENIIRGKCLQYPLNSFLVFLFEKTGIRASIHNSGLTNDTSLSTLIRFAVPVGTNISQINKAVNLIVDFFKNTSFQLDDFIIKTKPPGLFGLAKASFEPTI